MTFKIGDQVLYTAGDYSFLDRPTGKVIGVYEARAWIAWDDFTHDMPDEIVWIQYLEHNNW